MTSCDIMSWILAAVLLIVSVLYHRKLRYNKRLYAEYCEMRDAALVIHRRNEELEARVLSEGKDE